MDVGLFQFPKKNSTALTHNYKIIENIQLLEIFYLTIFLFCHAYNPVKIIEKCIKMSSFIGYKSNTDYWYINIFETDVKCINA